MKKKYPKAFVDWLLNFANLEIENDERWWKIEIETHIVELMSTETAYHFWKDNVKDKGNLILKK